MKEIFTREISRRGQELKSKLHNFNCFTTLRVSVRMGKPRMRLPTPLATYSVVLYSILTTFNHSHNSPFQSDSTIFTIFPPPIYPAQILAPRSPRPHLIVLLAAKSKCRPSRQRTTSRSYDLGSTGFLDDRGCAASSSCLGWLLSWTS